MSPNGAVAWLKASPVLMMMMMTTGVASSEHFGVSVLADSDLEFGVPVKPINELLRSFDLPLYRNYVKPPTSLPSMTDLVGYFHDPPTQPPQPRRHCP